MKLIPDQFPVERLAVVIAAGFVCSLAWRLPDAMRPLQGNTATLDFASRFGKHHVLANLGTVEEREEAIRRHIDDFLALKNAVEAIP